MREIVVLIFLVTLSLLPSGSFGSSPLEPPTELQNIEQLIVGGSPVLERELIAKSLVSLFDLRTGRVFCTGTLISDQLVLTAAHCTQRDPENIGVLFSLAVPQTPNGAFYREFRKVLAGRVPATWPKLLEGQQKDWGDIAVLRFEGEAPATYQPAQLDLEPLAQNEFLTLVGFGLVNGHRNYGSFVLRRADAPVTDPLYSDSEFMVSQKHGKGACRGDSGGPALRQTQLKGLQIVGVISRSALDPKETCEAFSVMTKISAYQDFLIQAIGELSAETVRSEAIPQPQMIP